LATLLEIPAFEPEEEGCATATGLEDFEVELDRTEDLLLLAVVGTADLDALLEVLVLRTEIDAVLLSFDELLELLDATLTGSFRVRRVIAQPPPQIWLEFPAQVAVHRDELRASLVSYEFPQ